MILRSIALMQDGLPRLRVAPVPQRGPERADAPDLFESTERCLALIGALADGKRHAFAALADRVLGPREPDGARLIRDAVGHLHHLGMPLAIDADMVGAARFVPLAAGALSDALPHWDARVVGSTESTNSDLLDALRAGRTRDLPMLLATELQRAGRGRLGRRWVSAPAVSLTASFALGTGRRLAQLDGVTLVCGLAVRDAVAACGIDARLKWPNDLLVDDRKLGGILVEAHAIGSATALVVGVGLNVGAAIDLDVGFIPEAPLAQRPAATHADPHASLSPIDLATCGARALDRNRLLIDVADALERRLARFDAAGFAAFVDEWNEADAFRDRPVRLVARVAEGRGDDLCGIARGVDATGALLVDAGGDGCALTRVISGDVSLRPEATPG